LAERQFLFYVGTEFYGRFSEAVALFGRNWPCDIYAPRPLNPHNKSVHGSNHALYDAACDYAERLAFAEAENHFDALMRRNDSDYADVAAQWLELIRLYAELIKIDEHRAAAFIFKRKWAAYMAHYPKEFLEGIFDPKDFASQYVTVTTKVETSIPASSPVTNVSGPRSTDLLPTPFAWIDIPGTKGKNWKGAPYKIAKYPVTNAQFAKFIDGGGYREQRWWTTEGWVKCQEGWHYDEGWKASGKAWIEPRYWNQRQWNDAEHPVVGITWFEAIAFCL
jgi:hypothetical protein